jgi:flagellar motor switch protein FliG
MALTGKQKAAMLLMGLDAATAAELLSGVDPKIVKELAAELTQLDAAGYRNSEQSLEFTRQFCNSLQAGGGSHLKNFLKELLKSAPGGERAIRTRTKTLPQKCDSFKPVHSIDSKTMASLLKDERPQVIAVVLSELQEEKSSEVLDLLGEGIRVSAISRMAGCGRMTPEAKAQIVRTICGRLEVIARESQTQEVVVGQSTADSEDEVLPTQPKQQSLREEAGILRSLGRKIRDGLFGVIRARDGQVDEKAEDLTIIWEDIPQIVDDSLEEALKKVKPGQLAAALAGADDTLTHKIISNISEQAFNALDKEASIVSAPADKDIKQARDSIVRVLREMNAKNSLGFVKKQLNVA